MHSDLPYPYRDERRDAEPLPPGRYYVHATLNVTGDPVVIDPASEVRAIRIHPR